MINKSELEILLNADAAINFAPESPEAEIAQNINTIFRTSKYSVPLDREFGLNVTVLDKPVNVAEALITNEIVEAIEKFEPRVKVTEIAFREAQEGYLKPAIKIRIL